MDKKQFVASPLFFPFTALTQMDEEVLALLFSKTVLLGIESKKERAQRGKSQVSQNQDDNGQVVGKSGIFDYLELPETLMEETRLSLLDYKAWAELNRGVGRGYLQSIVRDMPYFKSDTDISVIRTQIEKQAMGETAKDFSAADPSFGRSHNRESDSKVVVQQLKRDLLFLRLAHESDFEHALLDQTLSSIDVKEVNLLKELKGEDEEVLLANSKENLTREDRGAYMTRERIQAWGGVIKKHFPEDFMRLWVTTSPAVIDFLAAGDEKGKLILDIVPITVHKETCSLKNQWQKDFYRVLEDVIHGGNWQMNTIPQEDCGCNLSMELTLYLLSGEHVQTVLRCRQPVFQKSEFIQGSGDYLPVLLATVKK